MSSKTWRYGRKPRKPGRWANPRLGFGQATGSGRSGHPRGPPQGTTDGGCSSNWERKKKRVVSGGSAMTHGCNGPPSRPLPASGHDVWLKRKKCSLRNGLPQVHVHTPSHVPGPSAHMKHLYSLKQSAMNQAGGKNESSPFFFAWYINLY